MTKKNIEKGIFWKNLLFPQHDHSRGNQHKCGCLYVKEKVNPCSTTKKFRMEILFFVLIIMGYLNGKQWLHCFGETAYKNNNNLNLKSEKSTIKYWQHYS